MMNEVNLEFFLDKSRKELQSLCKNHNLPANRSHSVLAKSLALVFKKRSAGATMSRVKLVGPRNMSFEESQIQEPKIIGTYLEETIRAQGPNSYEGQIHGQTSQSDKILSCFMPICQKANQMEFVNNNVSLAEEKMYTMVNPVCPSFVNYKSSEGFGSTSGPGTTRTISHVATDLGAAAKICNVGCHEDGNRKEQKRSLGFRNVDHTLPCRVILDPGTCNDEMLLCGHKRTRESSAEDVSISGKRIAKRTPSFQFFVASERGVNLYVDFSISPLEWIKTMQKEHCIHQNAGHEDSKALSDNLSGLPDGEDHVEVLISRDTKMKFQNNGSDKNTGCTSSSLNSVVSENCNSENSPPDATAVSSRSSTLTLGAAEENLTVCLEENQVVSSSCATNIVENHLTSNPGCCSQELILVQNCAKTSIPMVTSKYVAPDASVISFGSMGGANLSPTRIGCDTVETAVTDSLSIKVTEVCKLDQVPAVGDSPAAYAIKKCDVSHCANLRKDCACEGSSMRQQMDTLQAYANLHAQLLSSSQLPGQVLLHPVIDGKSQVATDNDLLSEQPHNHSQEAIIPDDPTSKFSAELGQKILATKMDTLDESSIQSSLEHKSKTFNNSQFAGILHVSNDPICEENVNLNMTSSRSTRNSSKDNAADTVVLLRRSSRLISK